MEGGRPAKRARRDDIVINIPVHNTYDRSTYARPRPISLLPEEDKKCTGYIISKAALPEGPILDRTVQRRLFYIIGWRDLPSARVSIPATDVLDYISPRTLEEWEYKDQLDREAAVEVAAAEAAKEREALLAAAKSGKRVGRPPGRPGPGRPRKHVQIPTPVLDEEEEQLLAETKASGRPSLSTPQKPRKLSAMVLDEVGDTEAEELYEAGEWDDTMIPGAGFDEEEEEDAETALQRMLLEEAGDIEGQEQWDGFGDAMDVDSDDIPSKLERPAQNPRPGYAAHAAARATSSAGDARSSLPSSWLAERAKWESPSGSAKASTARTTKKPTPKVPKAKEPKRKGGTGRGPGRYPRGTKKSDFDGADGWRGLPPPHVAERIRQEDLAAKISPRGVSSATKTTASSTAMSLAMEAASVPARAGTAPPAHPVDRLNSPSAGMTRRGSAKSFDLPPDFLARDSGGSLPTKKDRRQLKPTPKHATPSRDQSGRFLSKTSTPSNNSAPPALSRSLAAATTVAVEKNSIILPDDEEDWTVQRLEGMRTVEVDGQIGREFKVRWEGDWPPEQNPTWEPEENISPKVVKRYLRKKEKQAARRAADKAEGSSTLSNAAAATVTTPQVGSSSRTSAVGLGAVSGSGGVASAKTQRTLASWLKPSPTAVASSSAGGASLSKPLAFSHANGDDGHSSEDELAAASDSVGGSGHGRPNGRLGSRPRSSGGLSRP